METGVTNFKSITLKLASPEKILSWSSGEVTKPETINYRTQRAERNGLFCERIFGPEKDYECYCGKYRRIRYKGIVCEKCGVEVTRSIVRRERMGHIQLATPVSHIWFLRGIPSRISLALGVPLVEIDKVVYFSGYIITKVNDEERNKILHNLNSEFKAKSKPAQSPAEKENIKKAFSSTKSEIESIHMHKIISEAEYYNLSLKYGGMFEASTGAEVIYNIFKKMDIIKIRHTIEEGHEKLSSQEKIKVIQRINLFKSMEKSGVRPEWMFLTVIPIVPPALRPMVALEGGRHATSDLNDLYRRVINRNNRLKRLLEIKAPEVITRNEKRMLQESVDALIDNSIRHGQNVVTSQAQRRPLKSLADMLKGKQGRFRQNLLGKRVDYSGRSVVVVGPELKLDQCGLPKHMALELFRPFVISKLIQREMAYNIRGAGRLIDDKTPEVWSILEEVIKDKYVLLNRAPTLHRLGIQAFKPILIEGNAIQIHPLVCSAFNADFDGDQMAVHIPLSENAQNEAKEIMASVKNLLRPGSGDPVVNPTKDIILGCYWMTKAKEKGLGEGMFFSTPNEAILSYDFGRVDLRSKIKVKATENPKYAKFDGKIFDTTVGRLLFNSVLPNDFPFINEELGKKALVNIVSVIIEKYGVDATPNILDKIKSFGFNYATKSGLSWGIDDLRVPEQKNEIIKKAEEQLNLIKKQFEKGLLAENECYMKTVELWQNAKDQVAELVPDTLDKTGSVYNIVTSASTRGGWDQINQMSGMKGLMLSPTGRVIDFPVRASYKEGLSPLEYFITTHGARKGEVDTALKTAKAGYLTRRLVDVAQDIVVQEEDCGDKGGIRIFRKDIEMHGTKLSLKIRGRVLSVDAGGFKKGHLLNEEDVKKIESSTSEDIYIRSPITCKLLRGICRKCYGRDLGTNQLVEIGEAVGIVAAQAIGEPGTQLTMRTFHTGGIAGLEGGDITMGLPRVEEIFELRIIDNPAVISDVEGEIFEIKDKNKEKIVTVLLDTKKSKEFNIPFGRAVIVKKGDKIEKGTLLTDGSADIKEMFNIGGSKVVQNYILHEVDKIYSSQGASINDKHIEIIIRQMFSRYKIKDSGDTNLGVDRVVDRTELFAENERVKKEGKQEAKCITIVMGISKVSLSTPGFLSAASFQDTTRVLIKAAIEGKEDKMLGLKENVIVGRLIPAGTGFKKKIDN
ncbi:MAG: DNA-directed RNA polymerase subunit beta' [Patescibacteria group bacterium]